MLVQVGLVFWLWTAILLCVAGGGVGFGLVLLTDLLLACLLGAAPAIIVRTAAVGAGVLAGSLLLQRKYGLGRAPLAAAGLGLVLGLVLRPALGLAGGGLLPALVLSRRSGRTLLLAFLAPALRLAAATAIGFWLLYLTW